MGSNDHLDEEYDDGGPDYWLPDCVVEYLLEECQRGDVAYEAAHNAALYAALWRDGELFWDISRRELAEHAAIAWYNKVEKYLHPDEWREVFRLAGYRHNDDPADRPTEPLQLWRGATPELRAGFAWTDLRDAAWMFASGFMVQPDVGMVWRATVEPERLLAKITHSGTRHRWQHHAEYVVDTEGLLIEPDGLWCACPVDLEPFRGDDRGAQIALDVHELIRCRRNLKGADTAPPSSGKPGQGLVAATPAGSMPA